MTYLFGLTRSKILHDQVRVLHNSAPPATQASLPRTWRRRTDENRPNSKTWRIFGPQTSGQVQRTFCNSKHRGATVTGGRHACLPAEDAGHVFLVSEAAGIGDIDDGLAMGRQQPFSAIDPDRDEVLMGR